MAHPVIARLPKACLTWGWVGQRRVGWSWLLSPPRWEGAPLLATGKVAPAGGAQGNGAGAEPTTQCLDAANLARDILANARDGAQLTVVDAKAVRSCDVGQYLVAVRFGGHPTEDTGVWASGSLELGELGSTVREPTEDDGILSWLVVGPPVVAAATLLWWLLNSALRSRLAAEAPRSWLLSTAAVLAPTAALFTDSPT